MASRERRNPLTLIGLVVGLGLVAPACSSDSEDVPADDDGATETTVDMNDDVHTDPDMPTDDE